jgi:hypothetical protein
MGRIRSLKPEFWSDEKIGPLDPLTRLVFVGLLNIADDAGRLVDSIKAIDGALFPFTNDSSRESLDILAKLSRIVRYTAPNGAKLIQISNFLQHQKIDHPSKRVLPPPPTDNGAPATPARSNGPRVRRKRQPVGAQAVDTRESFATHSRNVRDSIAKDSRGRRESVAPDLGARIMELGTKNKHIRPIAPGNGAETPTDGGTGSETNRKPFVYDDDFEQAWTAYPTRPNNPKRTAYRAWKARRRDHVSAEAILAGVRRYALFCDATAVTGTNFVKQAATFFGPDEFWTSEWTPPPQRAPVAVDPTGDALKALARKYGGMVS